MIFNASVEGAGLIALNKKTGDEVWRKGGMKRSWNTPALVGVNNGHELVVNTKGWLKAYDPQSGKPLWQCGGIDDYICPSVISNGGVVYAIGGRKNTCLAIKAGGMGNGTFIVLPDPLCNKCIKVGYQWRCPMDKQLCRHHLHLESH